MSFYLLTAFGQDRPGIVAQVTQLVYASGGNIQDASMTRLGGEFAIMLVVNLPQAKTEARFQKALITLHQKTDLILNAKSLSQKLALGSKPSHATHLISVYGIDHPGIVYKVAQTLANQRINITDLNTKTLHRTGKPLYVMMLEVQIVNAAKAKKLKTMLERLGRTLHLEIVLHDIEPIAL